MFASLELQRKPESWPLPRRLSHPAQPIRPRLTPEAASPSIPSLGHSLGGMSIYPPRHAALTQTSAAAAGHAGLPHHDLTSEAPPPVSTAPPSFVRGDIMEGPTYSPDGVFMLKIDWQTDATGGYIVQEVQNTQSITACDGSNHANGSETYWEAWSVLGDSGVSPSVGGVNDIFDHPAVTPILHTATSGDWQKQGNVYWVQTLDPAAGFKPGGARRAGVLLSTTTRPTNLDLLVETRTYAGHWDSCDPAHQTHTPS